MPHMPNAQAPVQVRRDRMYNVLDNGVRADGVTNNVNALVDLIETVVEAGGGDIYIPKGTYNFAINYNGAASPANRSIYLRDLGLANIRFIGDGDGSELVWGGNSGQGGGGGGASHFFYVRGRNSFITWEGLKILQSDLTNPDPGAEQHHLIRFQADVTGNCQFMTIRDCNFGLVKGDAVNMSGGFLTNSIKAAVPGSQSSGALTGLTNTTPTNLLPGEGLRVSVEFSGTWDGGTFTFVGTEPNGRVIRETIAKQNPGLDTVAGYRVFRTITSVTKNAGGTAGTADIGYALFAQHIDIIGCRFNGFDRAGDNPGYGYRSAIGVQRMSSYINIIRNYMTGSDDQLIDFEPTGNGYLGPWTIEYNTIEPLAVAPSGGADTCASFFGNANLFPLVRSSFSHNKCIGGGVIGGKLVQCDIVGNYFWIPEDARLVLQFTDRMDDVRIQGNTIEAIATGVGDVTAPCISMVGGGSTTVPDAPRNVQILDNILHWYCLAAPNAQPAMRLTVGSDMVVARNTMVNHGTATAVDVAAIKLEDPAVPVKNVRIEQNTIEAGRGGGSIQRGVDIPTRPSTAWTNLSMSDNFGTSVTATGVNVRQPNAGSYVNPPLVRGNRFPDATNTVVLGTDVLIMTGGNGGNAAGQYVAAATSPPAAIVGAGIGSTYHSMGNGGPMFVKTAADAWSEVTTE